MVAQVQSVNTIMRLVLTFVLLVFASSPHRGIWLAMLSSDREKGFSELTHASVCN